MKFELGKNIIKEIVVMRPKMNSYLTDDDHVAKRYKKVQRKKESHGK